MKVGVSYAVPEYQVWVEMEIPEDSSVQDAIVQSGIQEKFPDIDLSIQKVGIFGKLIKLHCKLQAGDRVEIYRPITANPKLAKRKTEAAPPELPVC